MISIGLYLDSRLSDRNWSPRICPGTVLYISYPQLVDRTRVEVEMNSFQLEKYRRYFDPSNFRLHLEMRPKPTAPISYPGKMVGH